jgi:hypothetical protein
MLVCTCKVLWFKSSDDKGEREGASAAEAVKAALRYKDVKKMREGEERIDQIAKRIGGKEAYQIVCDIAMAQDRR